MAGCRRSSTAEEEIFVADVVNGYTPVKDQGRGETCWIFAMLAAIETEHIGRGDSVNLSPYHVIRTLLEREAVNSHFAGATKRLSLRGTGASLIRAIERDGVVPYDAYHYGKLSNATVVANKVRRVAASRTSLQRCLDNVKAVLDASLGPLPKHVFMYGAEYTPQEFARSVCAPGEYEALTSFSHHPFNEPCVLEIPDNRGGDEFMNIPIDSLYRRVEEAVREGHGVCWEGDISEAGFSFEKGVARLEGAVSVTQRSRQRAFELLATTDDHCMAIIGIAHDSHGGQYFIMKNSWGTGNAYGGLMYMSREYFLMKTVAVFLPKVEP